MKKRRIALLTAITLLCGCSGSPAPSDTESTAESPAVTAEVSAPEQTDAPDSDAPAGINGGDNADSTPSQGVDLNSGSWTENDNLFKLNGTWCTPEDLPLKKTEYQIPDRWRTKDIKYTFGNGTMYLTVREKNDEPFYNNTNPPEVWYIDLATGEERLAFSGSEGWYDNVVYAGEKYLVISHSNETSRETRVLNALTGEVLLNLPETSENILLLPQMGTQVIYDTMYIGGQYTLPEFGKSVDAIFTIDLLTGNMSLFGTNISSTSYGSANLFWYDDGGTMTNILGEKALTELFVGSKTIYQDMDSGYYTVTSVRDSSDVLGFKNSIYWSDHDQEHDDPADSQHFLGETGYSVSAYDMRITKDCIFAAWLDTPWSSGTNLMIGKYDTETESASAAILDMSGKGSFSINSDNYNIYLMNNTTRKITIYSLVQQ